MLEIKTILHTQMKGWEIHRERQIEIRTKNAIKMQIVCIHLVL